MLHESLPVANRDERLRTDIAKLLEQYRESIAAVLRGHGHTDAMSSALAKTITATVDGAVLQRSLDPTFDMTSIAEILATALGTPPRVHRVELSADRYRLSSSATIGR